MIDKAKLKSFFDEVPEDRRALALDVIEEYAFFSEKIDELKKLPLIRVSQKNPAMQQITPAGKLLKDYSNVLDAKRATLLRILNQVEGSAADELINMLREFE